MTSAHVSIGQVKRDISELVNRVAFGGERIVLTSRGKPKAVIVSLDDLDRLENPAVPADQSTKWEMWMEANKMLNAKILAEHNGEPLDLDMAAFLAAAKEDLESRHDELFGR